MEQLVGKTIRKIEFSGNDMDLFITTDEHRYHYQTEGECCANAYLLRPSDSDIESIIGQKIVNISREAFDQQDGLFGDVVDTEFISIQTHGGDLDFEMRTEHNGYYGGHLGFVGMERIWPVFDDIREEAAEEFRR